MTRELKKNTVAVLKGFLLDFLTWKTLHYRIINNVQSPSNNFHTDNSFEGFFSLSILKYWVIYCNINESYVK